jgi:hypothetical protein
MTLRDEFLADIESAINECIHLGYTPTRFIEMIRFEHPVEVAKKLIILGNLQDGFIALNNMGRPELTVESIVLQFKYGPLFTRDERDAAQWRLDNV